MKTNKNILIRGLTDEDNKILNDLQKMLGTKTNSRTILKIIRNYASVKEDLEKIIKEFQSLSENFLQTNTKLNNVRQALGLKREMNFRKKIVIENGTRRI